MQKLRFILCLKYHQDSPKFWSLITYDYHKLNKSISKKQCTFPKNFLKWGSVKNHKLIIIGSDLMQQFLEFEITLQKNYSSRENLIIL